MIMNHPTISSRARHVSWALRLGMAALLVCLLPLASARAETDVRKSPLDGAPAVRKRVELREHRFEIGAGVSASMGQAFYNAVMLNLRAAFHLTDWFAVGAELGENLTPSFSTGFNDRLVDVLPKTHMAGDPVRLPTQSEALGAMNKISQTISLQGEITPFTGKYSLFSKFFMNYDFYALGGLGLVNLTADGQQCSGNNIGPSCPYVGNFKPGATFGLGAHSFINDWLALNLEVRDFFFRNNSAGRDTNGDSQNNTPIVDDHDLSWEHNIFVGLTATFFLSYKAAISD